MPVRVPTREFGDGPDRFDITVWLTPQGRVTFPGNAPAAFGLIPDEREQLQQQWWAHDRIRAALTAYMYASLIPLTDTRANDYARRLRLAVCRAYAHTLPASARVAGLALTDGWDTGRCDFAGTPRQLVDAATAVGV